MVRVIFPSPRAPAWTWESPKTLHLPAGEEARPQFLPAVGTDLTPSLPVSTCTPVPSICDAETGTHLGPAQTPSPGCVAGERWGRQAGSGDLRNNAAPCTCTCPLKGRAPCGWLLTQKGAPIRGVIWAQGSAALGTAYPPQGQRSTTPLGVGPESEAVAGAEPLVPTPHPIPSLRGRQNLLLQSCRNSQL